VRIVRAGSEFGSHAVRGENEGVWTIGHQVVVCSDISISALGLSSTTSHRSRIVFGPRIPLPSRRHCFPTARTHTRLPHRRSSTYRSHNSFLAGRTCRSNIGLGRPIARMDVGHRALVLACAHSTRSQFINPHPSNSPMFE
jgi:hypothetical protein